MIPFIVHSNSEIHIHDTRLRDFLTTIYKFCLQSLQEILEKSLKSVISIKHLLIKL